MSVAQATVTQKVSHLPVMPKYGFAGLNFMMIVFDVKDLEGQYGLGSGERAQTFFHVHI